MTDTTTTDPLLGFSPDEIVVGADGQTLAQATSTIRVRRLGYDLEHDVHDPARDVMSPEVTSMDAALDWIAEESGVTREHLVLNGSEIWALGACAALGVVERGPTRIPAELGNLPWTVHPLARAAGSDREEYVTGYLSAPDGEHGGWLEDQLAATNAALRETRWGAAWLSPDPGETRIVVRPRRIGDGGEVRCGDRMGQHDGVRLCGACSTSSPDHRTAPCGGLIERAPVA